LFRNLREICELVELTKLAYQQVGGAEGPTYYG
jgi:hypothetical protein